MKRYFVVFTLFCLLSIPATAGMPGNILSKIKAKAAQDFPDDYSTQQYVITTQKQAYDQIERYEDNRVPKVVLTKIMQIASRDFPLDFTTQKYVIDTQCSAYVAIQNYSVQDVP